MLLGFDFGMKYIGIATGQVLTKTSTPLTCINAKDGIPDWQEIEKIILEWRPTALVVGLPLNMDGSAQHLSHAATKFANRLRHKFRLQVHLVDERLSTWEAKQTVSNKNLKQINATAAAILLQQWLNEQQS